MLASAPERPWRDPGSQARQESRFSVSALLTSKAPFEVVDDSSFRADDQAQQQVVDVFDSITAFPQKGGLKRHLLHEWQRDANQNPSFFPPPSWSETASYAAKGFHSWPWTGSECEIIIRPR